jgi:HemY protein
VARSGCCDKCQAIHDGWHPVCDNCGSFDSLSWREPPASAHTPPGLAELLPLLQSAKPTEAITAIEDVEAETPDEILRRAN